MGNAYIEMKKQHEEQFNDFPMFFAFNDAQFKEGMEKFELDIKNDLDKITRTPYGGFMLKTDTARFKQMMTTHSDEMEAAIDGDLTGEGFILDMFEYELSNHEYIITMDVEPTLDALGISINTLEKNPIMIKALNQAINIQYAENA